MATTADPLWQLSATELARAIRSGQVSSVEVIRAHLQRIEKVNPAVNAVTVVLSNRALAQGRAADRALAAGEDLPALHGVPFTVKENIDLVGAPTTAGVAALSGAYPSRDAPAVEHLRAAGAIPLARTNCPSYAVRWHTDSELWGATVNPWDRSRTPGASSGGEAVALATGMSPLGLGSDGLGSLRWPAQCCGVSALKPTLGRVPHASTIEPVDTPIGIQLSAVPGPLARRVSDLWAAFAATAGPCWRDPWSVPAPLRGPEPAHPIRVALVPEPGGSGVAPQVRRGLLTAAQALQDAGYVVDEGEPPSIDVAATVLLDMLNTPDIRAGWLEYAPSMPPETQRFLAEFYRVAGDADPVRSAQAFAARQGLLRAWSMFQETYPVILAPVSADIPFIVGTDLDDVAGTIQDLRVTLAVNAMGLPAVALPVGVDQGLPRGVQLIGPRYREDICLDAAAAIEARLGVLTPIDPRPMVPAT